MANYLGKDLTKEELLKRIGNISQIASVKPYEMTEGKARGLKAYDVVTGSGLDFTVLEGKCLDIFSMKYNGINLNFVSKPGIVSPEYFNPYGVEFLKSFQGGMLYTCGLMNVGSACSDEGCDLCLHGRIGHTPAEKVSVLSTWKDDDYILEIAGEMREGALFNENLVLKRLISTSLGAKSVNIFDEVENQGFEEQPLMILYHFNIGYPLLDEGSLFLVPDIEVVPRDKEAKKGIDEFGKLTAPVDHFKEHVFYHRVAADPDGNTFAGIINERLGIGLYIKYNVFQLPRLIQWKSMASGDYVLGIEPANCYVEGRVKEKERGTLKKIAPMEKVRFSVEVGVLDGIAEIIEFKKLVKSLA